MNTLSNDHSHIPPVKGLHKMIRSSGYQAEDCILEYTDNSIDAGAKKIEIHLYARSAEEANIERICVLDKGGKAMNPEELLNGLTIAFQRIHNEDDIGAYGFGMKSASLNLGNELLVVSKQSGSHNFIGARMNFVEQERSNDYRPTATSNNAQADLFGHLPTDVSRELLTLIGTTSSVTVVQVTSLHLELASTPCDSFADVLLKKLSLAYSFDRLEDVNISIKVIKDEAREIVVSRVDPFYLTQTECLRKDPVFIQLYAIVPNNQRDAIRILEKNTFKRAWKKGTQEVAYTSGTPEHPIYYDLGGENLRAVDNPFEHPIPNTKPPIPFSMSLVFLKKETYDKEKEDVRKKGIWFRRGPRMVAQGLTLGIHGISAHGHYNQMRACLTFPPLMDKLMGAKYNKQINPKQGPLKEAIVRVWKDITSQWVKEKEAVRRAAPSGPAPGPAPSPATGGEVVEAPEQPATGSMSGTNTLSQWVRIGPDAPAPVEAVEAEGPQIVVNNGRLCLRVEGLDVASVDGLGLNSAILKWLQRVLERKGVQTTQNLLQQMNTILH